MWSVDFNACVVSLKSVIARYSTQKYSGRSAAVQPTRISLTHFKTSLCDK